MKTVSFELTMPNRASWNGRWSGEGRKFYVIKKLPVNALKQEHLKRLIENGRDSWYYRWEDGWGANVEAQVIDSTEARKRKKVSDGFCGYDWMIDSILSKGIITTKP